MFVFPPSEESQEETPLRPPSQQQQVTTRSSLSGDCQRVSKRSPPVGGYEFEIVRGLQAQHDPSRADSQSTVSGCTVSGCTYIHTYLHLCLKCYFVQLTCEKTAFVNSVLIQYILITIIEVYNYI